MRGLLYIRELARPPQAFFGQNKPAGRSAVVIIKGCRHGFEGVVSKTIDVSSAPGKRSLVGKPNGATAKNVVIVG